MDRGSVVDGRGDFFVFTRVFGGFSLSFSFVLSGGDDGGRGR